MLTEGHTPDTDLQIWPPCEKKKRRAAIFLRCADYPLSE